jgi:hypothetical protein
LLEGRPPLGMLASLRPRKPELEEHGGLGFERRALRRKEASPT